MRRLVLLLALAPGLSADDKDLEQPPVSSKARQQREEAQARWGDLQPLWEKIRSNKEITPAEAKDALPPLEDAIELFERSLREEWHGETNRALADAAKAWCHLRPLVPPPEPPTDEVSRKKAEREAEKERLARIRDIRDFVMKWGRERRADSLFRICPKCEGRREIRSPFGGREPCNGCGKRGRLVVRDAVIAARWTRHSPLHRAEARNEQQVNRLLRGMAPDEQRDSFAPYLVSVSIKEVEDNDLWARVKAQDTVQPNLFSKKTEKEDTTYVLFRVGRVWYVYDQQTDRPLLDIRDKLEEAAPPAK